MFLVIRIRGTTGVKQPIASTLEMLRLNRISHAVLVEENPTLICSSFDMWLLDVRLCTGSQ